MCLYEIYLQNSEFTNTVGVPKQRASRLILSFITGRVTWVAATATCITNTAGGISSR